MSFKNFEIIFIFLILIEFISSIPYSEFELNTDWRIENTNRDIVINNLNIPFSVHSALLREKKINEPYYRFNDLEQRWIPKDNNWRFIKEFDLNDTILNEAIFNLEFYSIDSPARVYLNNHFIFFAQNEFLKYTIENINSKLKSKGNKLELQFLSPIDYAKNLSDMYPYRVPVVCPPEVQKGECHVNKLRKQQSSFSWDWGPAFAPQSLYENVIIKMIKTHDISFSVSVYPNNTNDLNEWTVDVDLTIELNFLNINDFSALIDITIDELNWENRFIVGFDKSSPKIFRNFKLRHLIEPTKSIKDRLWYPNGFGKQNLFDLNVEVNIDQLSVKKTRKIGFRSVELIEDYISETDPSHGQTFYFKINNIPIFLKGSNWIPADSFQENIKDEYMEWLMDLAKDANMNILRIWGGGLYERKKFYDLADQLGIMIWHDMIFACSVYQTNKDFLYNVEQEITYQINRLRNHPSIILWAGNNENEVALAHNWYETNFDKDLYYDDYRKLYVEVIGRTIRSIEPEPARPYLVSSPSNGKHSAIENYIAVNPYDFRYGDVHFYDYNMDGWVPENYPHSRMVSEYGIQSFPSFFTLEPMIDVSKDADYYGNMSDHRQHHGNGNTEMENEIKQHLKLPDKTDKLNHFKAMIYLTQLNQAMSLKTSTEYFIRNRDFVNETGFGRCMGAMYWQFNDIWQGVSWSSIEYGGKMKMAHYFVKKTFANLLASPYISHQNHTFNIMLIFSEYPQEYDGEMSINVYSYDSFVATYTKIIRFKIQPHTSQLVYSVAINEFEAETKCTFDSSNSCLVEITFNPLNKQDSNELNTNFFLMNQQLGRVENLKLSKFDFKTVQNSQDEFEITIESSEIALFVWLDVQTNDFVGKFSDNGFHMTNKIKTITYKTNKPINKEDLDKNLKITSLLNIYDYSTSNSPNSGRLNELKTNFFSLILVLFGRALYRNIILI